MKNRKIILFGGTFDPIHIGHTRVAGSSLKILGAQKVIFVPAKKSPLKKSTPVASAENRLKMIELAIAGREDFEVSDYELHKSGPSFTIDTVGFFTKTLGGDCEIYWLMGADNIAELANWYKIEELIEQCNLAIMYRGGFHKPDFSVLKGKLSKNAIAKLEKNVVSTPLIDVSSTEIRKRLSSGQNVKNMVAPAVLKYIQSLHLYRCK